MSVGLLNTLSRRFHIFTTFTHDVKIMRKNKLNLFKKNILGYIKEFRDYDIYNLSSEIINDALVHHKFDDNKLTTLYVEEWKKE